MNCKICQQSVEFLFERRILNKYDVDYFQCQSCLFIQTEDPYWLDEAYHNSINLSDTGYIARNMLFRETLKYFFKFKFQKGDRFLDFGAGYGVFTRMMRDLNFKFYWSDEFTENLFSRGFEETSTIQHYSAITMFEVAEHLVNPFEEFDKLRQRTHNIIFSTELSPKNNKDLENWWYLGLEHGQHVVIWSDESVDKLAERLGLHRHSKGSLHFLTEQKLTAIQKTLLRISSFNYRLVSKLFGSLTWSDHKALK